MLQVEPVDPHHGRRQAVDPAGGVADVGVVGHVEQIGAHDQVGRSADGPTGYLGQDRFRALPELHEPAHVVVHELIVPNRVPCTGARGRPGRIVGRRPVWRFGAGRELLDRSKVETGGECPACAAEHDGSHIGRGGCRIDRIGYSGDHRLGQSITFLGSVQRDDRKPIPLFIDDLGIRAGVVFSHCTIKLVQSLPRF